MESELSGIFRVKLVTKNTVLKSPGAHLRELKGYWKSYIIDCAVKNHFPLFKKY